MNPGGQRQEWGVWAAAVVVSVAVMVGLLFRGLNGETAADAVRDIGGALIPILAAFVAARLVTRQMDPAQRFARAGEAALQKLQRSHSEILSGPKANSESYDPDNPGKAGRYLFFQSRGQGRRAQFIPVLPLPEGIVEIRVSLTTLLLFGFEREGLEQVRDSTQASVRAAVEAALQRRWAGTYDILDHTRPGKQSDIAIVVDFDESRLGPRRFGQAVLDCGTAALGVLAAHRR